MDEGKITGLIWLGLVIGYASRFVAYFSFELALTMIPIGVGIVLWGCYIWTRLKNRHWAFMFCGILAPIGLLGISLLKDKTPEPEMTAPTNQLNT